MLGLGLGDGGAGGLVSSSSVVGGPDEDKAGVLGGSSMAVGGPGDERVGGLQQVGGGEGHGGTGPSSPGGGASWHSCCSRRSLRSPPADFYST